jgi:hypothetical protein
LGNPFNKAAAEPHDVREVWFGGSHGDVGGGYHETQSALLKIPLQWMIEQTGPMGLHYRTQSVNEVVLGKNPAKHYVAPDSQAKVHDSMNWARSLLEFIPRIPTVESSGARRNEVFIPFFARRFIPEGARLHQSVIERANAGIKSANMPSSFLVDGP